MMFTRKSLRKSFLAMVVTTGAFVAGAGIAQAATVSSALTLEGQDLSASTCVYGLAQAIHPAYNGATVDLKAFLYAKARPGSVGCSPNNAAKNFYSGEASVRATLYRTSDFEVCTVTGLTNVPSGNSSFGVGKTWSKSGTCASTTNFQVGADGDWAPGLQYYGPYTVNFAA